MNTAGIRYTAVFMHTAVMYSTVCTLTREGYGVCGYGYGVPNLYPGYTPDEP